VFNSHLRTIKASNDPELAAGQWEQLCQACEKDSPTFIAELRKKREHYLAFLRYPEPVRRTFSTTNAVEAVDGQLEIMRRNNGAYLSSTDNLTARLRIAVERVETVGGVAWRSRSRVLSPSSTRCSWLASRARPDEPVVPHDEERGASTMPGMTSGRQRKVAVGTRVRIALDSIDEAHRLIEQAMQALST
jgi:hypothetical protein